jgi:hypothetical protein
LRAVTRSGSRTQAGLRLAAASLIVGIAGTSVALLAAHVAGAVPLASPSLTSTPSPTTVTLGTSPVTLEDTAVLTGGSAPTGTITFTLYLNSTLLDTEMATVTGNGSYTTPTGYTFPSSGVGTYQWDASYSGDATNASFADDNASDEQVTVSAGSGVCTPTGTLTITVSCPLNNEPSVTTGPGSLGTPDTWTVPAGVTQAFFTVEGTVAGPALGAAGPGGELQATLAVTGDSTYDVEVGETFDASLSQNALNQQLSCTTGTPPVCTYSQIGGGLSLVALGGLDPDDWQLVAGGGGAGSQTNSGGAGGAGGGVVGGNGTGDGAGSGLGGTSTCSGGESRTGGDVGNGGGGEGYCGGAAGDGGGGGGGSGFITTDALQGSSFLDATNSGEGVVTITYSLVPVNTEVPTISGTGAPGDKLTCANGTWADSPASYTYEFLNGSNVLQGPSSSDTYLLNSNAGQTITCEVVASNHYGPGAAELSSNSITVSLASPTLTTTPNSTSVILGPVPAILKDTAVLAVGYLPTGAITFTLYQGVTKVDTETVKVNGNGSYTTPTGYTLPTSGTVSGTYQWDATYSGDGNNNGVSDINDSKEQVGVASPCGSENLYFLSAVSSAGNFTGIFCVNASGTGTYAQSGGAIGTGTVSISGATTWIAASGKSLALLGQKTTTFSTFTETAPAPMKSGTFALTKIV